MLRFLLVATILSVGMIAALWSRFAALLTYVWFALFRPQEYMWFDVSALRLSFVIAMLLIVPSLLTGAFPNVTHPLSIGALLFLACGALAQVITPWPELSWPWLDGFIRLILVMLLSITLIDSRRKLLLFIAVMAGSMGYHTAKAGVTATLGGGVVFAAGLGGAFSDNNGYALAAATILPFLVCVWQNADRKPFAERWVGRGFLVAAPLSVFMVFGTMSRAGFLAVGASTLIYIGLQRRRFLPLATLIAVVSIGLPFMPLPPGYFDRLETIRTYEEVQEGSALSRLHFWEVATVMAEDNPLGVGLRNFDVAYRLYDFSNGEYGTRRSVHSSHFQVLAEVGYPGALLWIGLFGYAFICAFRVRRFGSSFSGLPPDESRFFVTIANACIVSMTAFLIGGAFIALALNDLTWYTFAIVGALDRLAKARRVELQGEGEAAAIIDAVNLPVRRRAAV